MDGTYLDTEIVQDYAIRTFPVVTECLSDRLTGLMVPQFLIMLYRVHCIIRKYNYSYRLVGRFDAHYSHTK